MTDEEMIEGITPTDWASSDEIIKVLGVGGGGCNAVDYMYKEGIKGCTFVVCNSDSPALYGCSVPLKISIGDLGAGTNPEVGRKYAVEHMDRIAKVALDSHTKMLFLTAGMGGGTGTGASPVIAEMAKSRGILTVGVVTIPFLNEGDEAMTRAIDGIHELEKHGNLILAPPGAKTPHFAPGTRKKHSPGALGALSAPGGRNGGAWDRCTENQHSTRYFWTPPPVFFPNGAF